MVATVGDPGFPRRGEPPRWGRQPIIWRNVSQTLYENERNWTEREGTRPWPPMHCENYIENCNVS